MGYFFKKEKKTGNWEADVLGQGSRGNPTGVMEVHMIKIIVNMYEILNSLKNIYFQAKKKKTTTQVSLMTVK